MSGQHMTKPPFYSFEQLLAAEARQVVAREANDAERARAHKRTTKVVRMRATLYRKRMWRMSIRNISTAMDLAATNLWRGKCRSIAALLLFEKQWQRERRWLRRHGLRISGYDAVEQFVRRIRLWRVAGVLQ